MAEIRIVAEMRLLPGQKNMLEFALKKLVEGSRAEKGNLSYDLVEDLNDPDHLFVIERWASEEAIAEHNTTAHFREFRQLAEGKTSENRVTLLKDVF